MSIPEKHRQRNAYHFTSLDNLGSIIEYGGIFSTNQKNTHRITHTNIANEGIQNRRASMQIPSLNNRVVHDYVPFYFAKKTPMQLAVINKKNIDQQFIIYFSIPISLLKSVPGAYFTDASANTDIPPNFFSGNHQANKLDLLDWEIIDSYRWSYAEGVEKNQKMAELLLPNYVPLCEVNQIITWDNSISDYVKDAFQDQGIVAPNIVENNFEHYYGEPGNWSFSLVTGPLLLKESFEDTVKYVESFNLQVIPKYQSLTDALNSIRTNFSAIKELEQINELVADYGTYEENIGAHTRRIVDFIVDSPEYIELETNQQEVLEFSAYLHDIGRKPNFIYQNEVIHKLRSEHHKNSLPMLKRILTEELPILPFDIVRKIIMLVTYHDLLIDIVSNGRDKTQFFDIVGSVEDIIMLVALSKAIYAASAQK